MALFDQDKLARMAAAPAAGPLPLVLVVDDEAGNRQLMCSVLSSSFRLLQADSAQTALRLIAACPEAAAIACVVSDQRMPGMTGVRFLEQVHALLPDAMRLIVTGHVDLGDIIDSINQAEIYRFIVKPFAPEDLLLTVRRAAEVFELRRRLAAYQSGLEQAVGLRTAELEQSRRALLEANALLMAEVAERRRAEAALRHSTDQLLALYDNAACGYLALYPDGRFARINSTQLAWLGFQREELVDRLRLQDLAAPASWEALLAAHPHLAGGGWTEPIQNAELELLGRRGQTMRVLFSAMPEQDPDGQLLCRFTVFNITQRSEEHERMRFLALHDGLTRLANRAQLEERLGQALQRAKAEAHHVALVYIDLDGFKPVNDRFGHHVGDELLRLVARRLERCVREQDCTARIGGDEFVICLAGLKRPAAAQALAAKVLAALGRVFLIGELPVQIGASLGVSVFPDDAGDAQGLMRLADEAMYRAKQAGRNRCLAAGRAEGQAACPAVIEL
jgi:diguanylate cyclase (GGDEF)-like protein